MNSLTIILASTFASTPIVCDENTADNTNSNVLLNQYYEPKNNLDYLQGVEEIRKAIKVTDGDIVVSVNWFYMENTTETKDPTVIKKMLSAITLNFKNNKLPIVFELKNSTQINESYVLDDDNCTVITELYSKYAERSRKVLNIISGDTRENHSPTGNGFTKFLTKESNHVDGVFYTNVKPDSYGPKILTHEFGHWLGLLHPFWNGCSGENNDFIKDTPRSNDTFRLSTYTPNSFSWECNATMQTCPGQNQTDLVNNFMDYTLCGDSFTDAQKYRMMSFLYFRFFGETY